MRRPHIICGWTLHDLRHSALTHAAEDGMPTPMLMTKSKVFSAFHGLHPDFGGSALPAPHPNGQDL